MSKILDYPFGETKRIHRYFGIAILVLPPAFLLAGWICAIALHHQGALQ